MLDVIIAMLPALVFAVVKFGFKALTLPPCPWWAA